MYESVELAKKELVLLDYETIERKLQLAENLIKSTNPEDKAKAESLLKEVELLKIESRPIETRAVWLDDIALGKITSPEEMRQMVRRLHDLNVNLLLPSVYFGGETMYKSNIVPQMDWFRLYFNDVDPLQVLIDEAHSLGMEVHAWVMVYGLQGNVEPFLDRLDWLDRDRNGKYNNTAHTDYFFSPAHPEAREHIMSIINEVTDYNLDGIHLDNIRYKDGFGYGDYAVNLYKELTGIDARSIERADEKRFKHFQEFKAQFIASLVERVRSEMHKKNPHLMVSAATAPRLWGKNSLGQDWHNWIDNRSLHFVLTMSYIETPPEYDELINWDIDRIGGRTYCYPGMSLYAFSPAIMQAEWQVGQKAAITGQTLFSLLHIKPEHDFLLQAGLFREKAMPTFREPEKAAIEFCKWILKRINLLGSEAGFTTEQIEVWQAPLQEIALEISKATMRPYDRRDLREADAKENATWQKVLAMVEDLSKKTDNLPSPTRDRLRRDLAQLNSLITPLEYTSRLFEQIPITY